MRVIISRTDRAGDLILTTPVFREIRKNFPKVHVIAHVRKYTAPVLKLCPWVDEVIIDEDYPAMLSLTKKFIDCQVERIIVVHPAARVLQAAFLARIPSRTGRASNIWQFLLNDRRVQKRSRNEMHEYRYNLQLLEGIVEQIDDSPPELSIKQETLQIARKLIEQESLLKPVLIHPGHGGSAYNLSPAQYAQIAENLVAAGIQVAVSLGPGEEHLAEHFAAKPGLAFIKNVPDLEILAGVIRECAAFIGGSTGPMHLAAALDLPVLAFFPPVRAMTPKRWGPVCAKKLVLLPEADHCFGKCQNCPIRPCMKNIDLHLAENWIKEQINS